MRTSARNSSAGNPSAGNSSSGNLARRWIVLAAAAGLLQGCEARLSTPSNLWWLWILPVLCAYIFAMERRRRALLARFAEAPLLRRLSAAREGRRFLRHGLVALALGAMIFSLSGLEVGFDWEEVQRQGVDLVIALDTSDSMLVRDVESGGGLSRLERAKREIQDLLDLLQGDRVALVAFAGTSFLELPLTLDYGAAELFLSAIDNEIIPVKGTNLSSAIRTSVEAFESGTEDDRALILITDGEDHDGQAIDAAREAADQGVRIFTIGIGREEGAPIPRAGGGFRRDRNGEIILSRLDEPTLQRIALETGGRYVRSVTGDVDLEQIYLQGVKATLADRELGAGRRQRWNARFQWLLGAAMLLLMIEMLIPTRRDRPTRPELGS